jgi:hypothetical protein
MHAKKLEHVRESTRKRKKLVRILETFFPHYNELSPIIKL